MGNIVYAWELGGGEGHFRRFAVLARELKARGHRVTWSVIKEEEVRPYAEALGQACLPAPKYDAPPPGMPEPPLTYYEMAFRFGFLQPEALYGRVRAWRDLLLTCEAGLMVADHSPAAMLAARIAGVPVAMLGTGFCAPPEVEPLPNLVATVQAEPLRLLSGAQRFLATANAVLADFGAAPLARACDLFAARENFLATFAEIDPYHGLRAGARYWHALQSESAQAAAPAPWPGGEGPRVFAYLSTAHPQTGMMLKGLKHLGWPVLAYVAGLGEEDAARCSGETLHIAARPLPMAQVAVQCDVGVCHAGHGTVCDLLLAGKPMFTLPMWREQALTGQRLEHMGAGISFEADRGDRGALLPRLRRVATEPGFAQSAQAFAARYAGVERGAVLAAIADRCGELLR